MTDQPDNNDSIRAPFASQSAPQKPAPQRDEYGRDVSQWIPVGGKLKPHP